MASLHVQWRHILHCLVYALHVAAHASFNSTRFIQSSCSQYKAPCMHQTTAANDNRSAAHLIPGFTHGWLLTTGTGLSLLSCTAAAVSATAPDILAVFAEDQGQQHDVPGGHGWRRHLCRCLPPRTHLRVQVPQQPRQCRSGCSPRCAAAGATTTRVLGQRRAPPPQRP